MSKYICPNCKYDFKQKSHYIRHIYQKKNPCKIIKIDLQNLQKNIEMCCVLRHQIKEQPLIIPHPSSHSCKVLPCCRIKVHTISQDYSLFIVLQLFLG